MELSLVVAGHSHAAALGVPIPAEDDASAPNQIAIEDAAAMALAGAWPRDDAYWAALEDAARERVPAIVWSGTQHHAAFLVEPVPPIDFVLSAAPDLPMDPRASYVAESQLRALFAPSIEPLGDLVRRLVAVASGPVLVAGTPPPLGDPDAIAMRVVSDTNEDGEPEDPPRLSSPYTMQKLWSLVQSMLAETTVVAGGVFVPVPDRVRGADGFLREDYWSEDAVHANEHYGREMLRELVDVARATPTNAETDDA